MVKFATVNHESYDEWNYIFMKYYFVLITYIAFKN